MKNLLFICFAIAYLAGCKYDDKGKLFPCLEAKLGEYKTSDEAKTIKTQEVNGETHYWLNTDSRYHDGIEYILNETCDTVCYYIGDPTGPVLCEANYVYDAWEIIWEK